MTLAPQNGVFHTIVWATDGSASSVAGTGFVRGACERYDSALRIVHVVPPMSGVPEEQRIAKLKAVSASLRRRGVSASLHVVRGAMGSPAPHIAEVARMVHADLVIVTSHGRSPVTSALAGSTTLALIARAPCPVPALPAAPAAACGGQPRAVTPPLAASA